MRYVLCFLLFTLPLSAEQRYLSPSDIAVSADGSVLYIACATANRIQLFDIETEKVSSHFDVEGVREFALSPDETRLFALCGEFKGRLVEIDTKSGKAIRSFSVGHTPMSPVVSPDGKTLFFCNRFSRAGLGDRVRMLSVSFDPLRDPPGRLRDYGENHGARGELWNVARVQESDLELMKRGFGLRVIADGMGGFQHNTAIHLIDRTGNLSAIFDTDDEDGAFNAVMEKLL